MVAVVAYMICSHFDNSIIPCNVVGTPGSGFGPGGNSREFRGDGSEHRGELSGTGTVDRAEVAMGKFLTGKLFSKAADRPPLVFPVKYV